MLEIKDGREVKYEDMVSVDVGMAMMVMLGGGLEGKSRRSPHYPPK